MRICICIYITTQDTIQYKTRPCKNIDRYGACAFGPECHSFIKPISSRCCVVISCMRICICILYYDTRWTARPSNYNQTVQKYRPLRHLCVWLRMSFHSSNPSVRGVVWLSVYAYMYIYLFILQYKIL